MTSPLAVPAAVGVIGGGRMGSGIAHAFLLAGAEVAVVEADPAAAERALASIVKAVQGSADRGLLTQEPAAITARCRMVAGPGELADRKLVIEVVPEQADIKNAVLQGVSEAVADDCVIASNTSSFSIDELARAIEKPERFLGLHFFNPVPASQLVEVVVGADTSAAVVAAAQQWVTALGKTAVTVKDSPGFASSRLGVLLGLEAIRMLEEGVGSAEDIDNAIRLGYGHPMGPLRLTDLVGLDVRLGVAEYLTSKLGDRFAPPELLREMVARGDLGRKTGRGFFSWNN